MRYKTYCLLSQEGKQEYDFKKQSTSLDLTLTLVWYFLAKTVFITGVVLIYFLAKEPRFNYLFDVVAELLGVSIIFYYYGVALLFGLIYSWIYRAIWEYRLIKKYGPKNGSMPRM